jgi:hypothetical protein
VRARRFQLLKAHCSDGKVAGKLASMRRPEEVFEFPDSVAPNRPTRPGISMRAIRTVAREYPNGAFPVSLARPEMLRRQVILGHEWYHDHEWRCGKREQSGTFGNQGLSTLEKE